MNPRNLVLLAGLLAAGCAGPANPPPPVIPVGALGTNQDSDLAAVNLSSYMFGEPGRLVGNPVATARAAASVEYLADALSASPRWQSISPDVVTQMQQARIELNRTLAIAPGAAPQRVIDGLLGAATAMQANDAPAATTALDPAVFTLGPQQTLNLLARMPFQPTTNIATARLNSQYLRGGNRLCVSCG